MEIALGEFWNNPLFYRYQWYNTGRSDGDIRFGEVA